MKKILILLLFITFISCSNSNNQDKNKILIMCGAANRPPIEEIAKKFEKIENVKIELVYNGSGALLSQMKMANKGDIFIPGSPDFIKRAEKLNIIKPNKDHYKLTYLIPTIIVPKNNPKNIKNLDDLTKKGVKIAIASPETVALGPIAIEIFEKNGVLEKVFPNIVTFSGSASKLLSTILLKKVDAIIGFKVFEKWNPKMVKAIEIKPEKLPNISYVPLIITKYGEKKEVVDRFLKFIKKDGKKYYKKHGYISDKDSAYQYSKTTDPDRGYILPEKYYKLIKR